MKVVILCGGEGIRLKHEINFIPKGLVYIDEKPIIWHIMKRYSQFGFKEFVLALGKNGDMIRDYFLNYDRYTNNIGFTIRAPQHITHYDQSQEEDWNVTLVNTGEFGNTGVRLQRCQKYIDGSDFMLTYSDCLCSVNLHSLLKHHEKRKKTVTVTGIMPPFRYGEFVLKNNRVTQYNETSTLSAKQGLVNGGYMVLNKNIFEFLTPYNECTLENEVFKKLIVEKDLNVYRHDGFWQCLDNDREFTYLKKLCESNKRYWLSKNI
ncbi:glucose-1-phosphate cytidylyltransferase [Candidatus Roizmanbacteria bacterium]|nr:glucose-1-phosphate cytidylyltransferase [Candidatus Roizmanbacteria bacterium]